MSVGRVNVLYRFSFSVKNNNGTPRAGLVDGDFTITVRNPQVDAILAAPTVVEDGLGMYHFDIPASFSSEHGAGPYGAQVEVTKTPKDMFNDPVTFESTSGGGSGSENLNALINEESVSGEVQETLEDLTGNADDLEILDGNITEEDVSGTVEDAETVSGDIVDDTITANLEDC